MRKLIDADELVVDARLGEDEIPYVSKAQIDEAPTVDAIPIEFIKQLIEKFNCERGNAIKDTYAHILSALLEFWEFEQKEENEAN